MSQRMLRGMAAGLGALVSLGSMAGCGTDGQVQKATSIKIGVTVYDQYDTFVSQMMTDFNEYAAEQEEQTGIAINVEVYNAAGSQSTQNSQVEEMLDAGCNVICVNLVDRTEPTTIIDMAENLPEIDGTDSGLDPQNPMELRRDVVIPSVRREEILKNAPATQSGCVVVPKTVE